MAKRRWPNYVECCDQPDLFGPWFAKPTWATWRVIDKAVFGLPMDEAELATFTALTGRSEAPTEPCTEAWLAFGRRAGKDVKAASYATYLGTIGAEALGWRKCLTRGERGVVQLLAKDRKQAKVAFDYISEMFEQPVFKAFVTRITADTIDLKNRLSIEITTNDKGSVRGRTVCCAICDEVAHWRSDNSVSPDTDVVEALVPSMATIPNALLIGISSPYSRRGLLWQKHERYWGKPGSVLVARAPTWVMNPTLTRDGKFIKEQFEKDAAWASGEYGAEWRSDLEAFVSREVVMACIKSGVRERQPDRRHAYVGFVDPSGGSNDSFTLAIAHTEQDGKTQVLDALRERTPPFSPEAVVDEFCSLLKAYRVTTVYGDKYAGEWPAEQFKKRGVHYEQAAAPKSQLYQDLLPMLNSGAADLLDNDRLVVQLCSLERRTTRGGRDTIDHPPNAHDDLANAAAGALVRALKEGAPYVSDDEERYRPRRPSRGRDAWLGM